MALRTHKFVLPSGVECEVRNMKGSDYDTITNPKLIKNNSQFDQLVKDILVRIGDKEPPFRAEFINNMLSNDRKLILLECRQHTMHFEKEFVFKYEWPLVGQDRDVQEYTVNFTREGFPVVPYSWVREHEDYKKGEPWPVLFDSYDQVMEKKAVDVTLPGGDKVTFDIMDGNAENRLSSMDEGSITINAMLTARNVRQLIKMSVENKPVWSSFNFRDADAYDLEFLRKKIAETEGSVNTFLNIQNQKDERRQVRVDLLQTQSFFFPSQAL